MKILMRIKAIWPAALISTTLVLSLLLMNACGLFEKDTVEETGTTETASELPGNTDFTPTTSMPSNGAALGAQPYDMFLYIEGLPGESADDTYTEWINVLSYSWGVSMPSAGVISSGLSRSSEGSIFTDFVVTKELDKASPKLALYCSNGQHITEAVFVICGPSESGTKIMEYQMTDVIITSVFTEGTAGEEIRPSEQVGLAYAEIRWIYTELDEMGMAKGNVETYWELVTNTGG